MKMKQIKKTVMATTVTLALVLGGGSSAFAIPTSTSIVNVQTGIRGMSDTSVRSLVTQVLQNKASYEALLEAYKTRVSSGKSGSPTFKALMKSWRTLKASQTAAKKQIGREFRKAVDEAKRVCAGALLTAKSNSDKARAKAAKSAAIAAASAARNASLNEIKFQLSKPENLEN